MESLWRHPRTAITYFLQGNQMLENEVTKNNFVARRQKKMNRKIKIPVNVSLTVTMAANSRACLLLKWPADVLFGRQKMLGKVVDCDDTDI